MILLLNLNMFSIKKTVLPVPIRVRHDKTNQYRYADENNKTYGNAYHVADGNWHSIHSQLQKI